MEADCGIAKGKADMADYSGFRCAVDEAAGLGVERKARLARSVAAAHADYGGFMV